MRLLHVVHSVDRRGGGPIEALAQRARVLLDAGHTIEVATLDSPDYRDGKAEFAPTHYLGRGKSGGYGYTSAFVPWLRVAADRFDAVTVHGLWQYQGLGTWRALSGRGGPPYFVFPHGMLDPWFKRTYPLKHLKKWLYWPWAEYRVLRDARAVLFTSEEERRLARQSFNLYQAREQVVNYGTAAPRGDSVAQRDRFLDQYPELRGKRCLLFLGRLHVKKGPDLLLRAWRDLRATRPRSETENVRLVMAGPVESDYGRTLTELARRLDLADQVIWTGMLAGEAKWGAFYAADAFVLPSHQENFGVAVVEALACGAPVLISSRVNIWREIESDGAGFVDSDDLAGTTRLLERWLSTDRTAWGLIRGKARSCFMKRFNIENTAEALVDLFATTAHEMDRRNIFVGK